MTAYIKAALDRACAAILAAPNGAQETTLHREAFSIGGLIGADLSGSEAFAVLLTAAESMPAHGEPWRNIERQLRHLLSRGMERPRQRPEAASVRRAPAPPLRVDGCALSLWRKSVAIDHTPADLYLRARGFTPPYPATLRFLPGRGNHPHALIAAFGLPDEPEPDSLRMPDAAVRAVHLTRLDPTGMSRLKSNNARIIVGQAGLGFPVAVTPINDGLGLLIAEGIENALSLGLSTGLGAWAACSHTRMPPLAQAVPDYVASVSIVADPEPAARASGCALAERLEWRGFNVIVKPMGEAV